MRSSELTESCMSIEVPQRCCVQLPACFSFLVNSMVQSLCSGWWVLAYMEMAVRTVRVVLIEA